MAQKKVWMTWLPRGEGAPGPDATVSALSQVGLEVAGSHWIDDLEKVAWVELGGLLLDTDKADIWLIAGREADFSETRIRYGLSMVAAMVSDIREDLAQAVATKIEGLGRRAIAVKADVTDEGECQALIGAARRDRRAPRG